MNLNTQGKSLRQNFPLTIVLLVIVSVLSACGQGGISGHVTNLSGDPIAGVAARLAICVGDDCTTAYEVTTADDGGYAFEGVELGRYTLAIEWVGSEVCYGLPRTTREGFRIDQAVNESGHRKVVGKQEIDYISHEQSFRTDLSFPCR